MQRILYRMITAKFSARLSASTLLLSSLALMSAYASKASEIAIHFKRGAYVAQAGGELKSMHDEVSCLVSARAGQHMKVKVDAPGAIRGLVTFPDGNSQGSPGDVFFDDVLPTSGDYHIQLRESPMGEERHGKYTLTLEIR
jgi:hypothetical protein